VDSPAIQGPVPKTGTKENEQRCKGIEANLLPGANRPESHKQEICRELQQDSYTVQPVV